MNFIFPNSIKRHISDVKLATKAGFTYINKGQSDFAILQGFYFHETSHMRSFAKIKSSQKFPNLQYTGMLSHHGDWLGHITVLLANMSGLNWIQTV